MTDELGAQIIRYGAESPPDSTRTLRAGPVSLVYENGTIRNICIGKVELLRQVYVAVRDKDWGTVVPNFVQEEILQNNDSFIVRFTASHRNSEVDYLWDGLIEGTASGIIRFEMAGQAQESFLKNRVGFCLLHPMELAGTSVSVRTPDGETSGFFPTTISPHQPFKNIIGMSHEVEGIGVDLSFEGEIFEMEDQRNWTDASYKTYCTPLELPFPVRLLKGDRVRQTVELRVTVKKEPPKAKDNQSIVVITDDMLGDVPRIGLVNDATTVLDEARTTLLSLLSPHHLRLEVDLSEPGWEKQILLCNHNASLVRASIDLEVLVEHASQIDDLFKFLASMDFPIDHVFVFDKTTHVTTSEISEYSQSVAENLSMNGQIGGGSRAFFTELNRGNVPDSLGTIGYPLTPQVHAFDNVSVMETLQAQPVTVETARRKYPDAEIVVGPITLGMRFNPNATSKASVRSSEKLEADPRQRALFCAAWTTGSIAALSSTRVSELTYFRVQGSAGVMDGSRVFPVFHLLCDVSELGNAKLMKSFWTDKGLAVLALKEGLYKRVLVGNLTDAKASFGMELATRASQCRIRYLDETTAEEAMTNPFTYRKNTTVVETASLSSITLLPYAVVCIDVLEQDGVN